MPTLDRKRLLDILDSRLNAEEVATLVFDLALDPANLEGAIKRARLRSLIDYCERRGQMDQLITTVIALRPDVLPPDTVYAAPRIAPPHLGWQFPAWRRWLIAGLLIALVLAAARVGAQWYGSPSQAGDPAIARLTRLIQQQPNNPTAYYERAELYRNKSDYDHAIADYSQVIKLRPDDGTAYYFLGVSYDAIGNQAGAFDNYTKAIELAPTEWVFLGRGSIYVKRGDLDHALNDFTEAIRLGPTVIQGYYNRGLVYQQKNENAKAMADFEKVLELSPDATWQRLAEEQLKALKAR